ncbi:methyl-accepting chemotaxis protein [Pseudoalteromonas sp. SS15]|uniref:methyl-accepting chemotaxis protein n=1 Tax=Pseudoalteromonas sp. SS15 TaxID=3139393 RepID=UPI003BAD128C
MSISKKLIWALLATLFVPIVIVAVIMVTQARQQAFDNFSSANTREVEQVDNAISMFFSEISKDVMYIAQHPNVIKGQSGIATYLASNTTKTMTPEKNGTIEASIFDLFNQFGSSHPGIAYIYMGNQQGGYTQWPKGSVSANYDPRPRPWFKKGLNASSEPARTNAYYWEPDDAVIVSTVKSLKDSRGNVFGVTGMDVSLKGLTELIQNIKLGESGYLVLVEDTGTILVDAKHPKNNFKAFSQVSNGLYQTLAEKSSGQAEIDIDGDNYIANIYTSPNLKWKFVGLLKKSEVMASANAMTWVIVVVSILLLLLLSPLSVYLARLISNPIIEVTDGLEQISQGEGDLSQRLQIRSNDETGKLAGSFNQFLGSISALVNEINDSSGSINQSSDKTKALSQNLSNSIQMQQMALEQAATAINEMAATANEVAASCASAADSANQTKDAATDGKMVIEKTVDSVQVLSQTLSDSASNIEQLDNESESITSILDVIRGIAEQTNLLALNAAIEAARAGEQGRGFAVVADEVRALSVRTSESTEEISTQLSKLRQMTQGISQEMKSSLQTSSQTVEYTQEAQQAFNSITDSVDLISDMNSQIATAAEEQQHVAEDINRNVVDIKTVADEVAEVSVVAESNAQNLSELAARLNALVGRFKT